MLVEPGDRRRSRRRSAPCSPTPSAVRGWATPRAADARAASRSSARWTRISSSTQSCWRRRADALLGAEAVRRARSARSSAARSRAGRALATSRSCCSETRTAWPKRRRPPASSTSAGLARTAHGTPRLDSAFALADARRALPLRCFVNADIILGPTADAAERVDRHVSASSSSAESFEPGQTRDAGPRRGGYRLVRLPGTASSARCRRLPSAGPASTTGCVWKARQVGIVVDATHDVRAVHQPHDYDHVAGGKEEAYYGEEAARNLELAGGKAHLYTLHDASHVLARQAPAQPRRHAALRARASARLGVEAGPAVRVAFVSPEPTPYRAPLLDRVAARPEIELTVDLRGSNGRLARLDGRARPPARCSSAASPFPARAASSVTTTRSRRAIFGALGDARPEVVVVSGWSTFAAQAALAWCRAAARSVRAARREPRRRAQGGLAPPRQDDGGAADRAWRRFACSSSARSPASPWWRSALIRSACACSRTRSTSREYGERRRRPARAPASSFGRRSGSRRTRSRSLTVARLVPEKGLDTLLRAARRGGDVPRAVVGSGSERADSRARRHGDAIFTGERPARPRRGGVRAADVFALLSRARAVGRRRERSGRVRAAARALGPRRRCARPPARRRERRSSCRAGDVDGRRPTRSSAPVDPDLRRALRRAIARARRGVGLRAVGGELRRGLPRGDRLAVDLFLRGRRRAPRTSAALPPAARRESERAAPRRRARVAARRSRPACVVRDDESLALARRSWRCRSGR